MQMERDARKAINRAEVSREGENRDTLTRTAEERSTCNVREGRDGRRGEKTSIEAEAKKRRGDCFYQTSSHRKRGNSHAHQVERTDRS